MTHDKIQPMTKLEIANFLQVSINDILRWAQPTTFGDWLDVCPQWHDRVHDEYDVWMFMLISQLNEQIGEHVPFDQRVQEIQRKLHSNPTASSIRAWRKRKRDHPEVARWSVVAANGACLRYEYEWLKPLRPSVDNIAHFGCRADAQGETCSEPYALLWTLEATKVVVIDKEREHIRNARLWLKNTRQQHSYFEDYPLEFEKGDMTDENLVENIDALDEDSFGLSYCHSVLYNMYPSPNALRVSVDIMARVVKPGGWVIAIESQLSKYKDEISKYFKSAGLVRFNLDGAPKCSYCYQKPQS